MVHIYDGISLSHEKGIHESVLVTWMNLEPVIQSKVSQKEKQIPCINTYIWDLEKMVLLDLFAGQEERHRHREQTYGQGGRRRGRDESRE